MANGELMSEPTLSAIQADIKIWADECIPSRTPSGQMKHLERELNELKVEWETQDLDKAKEELADILIVALNLAGQMGFDMQYEVLRKMEINRKRTWSRPDSEGVIHHL
jgi:NTP pyrophosphatase (non-canonical NTP hydrolase)